MSSQLSLATETAERTARLAPDLRSIMDDYARTGYLDQHRIALFELDCEVVDMWAQAARKAHEAVHKLFACRNPQTIRRDMAELFGLLEALKAG